MSADTAAPVPTRFAIALAAGAFLLGAALKASSGHLSFAALGLLTMALACLVASLVTRDNRSAPGEQAVVVVLGAGLYGQLAVNADAVPGDFLVDASRAGLWPMIALYLAAMIPAAWLFSDDAATRRRAFLTLLAVHLALGAWMIRSTPAPHIDVYLLHREGLSALLRGENPYALRIPNPYPHDSFYGPGQVRDGFLTFGYCYPPLPLLLGLPGHILGGDYRWSSLVLTTVGGGLLGFARPSRVAPLAAAMFLFMPRFLFVLEHGWTDLVVAALFCLVIFTALRARRALPVALGLFFASKQYTFLALPPALLLLVDREELHSRRFWIEMVAAGALATLPMALWDVRAFTWSVLELQFHSPFRPDALSYLALLAQLGGPELPASVGFLAATVAMVLGIARAPRGPAGFAATVATTYLAFFALNKQAFCNYHFFVVAAACAACAAAPIPSSPARPLPAGT